MYLYLNGLVDLAILVPAVLGMHRTDIRCRLWFWMYTCFTVAFGYLVIGDIQTLLGHQTFLTNPISRVIPAKVLMAVGVWLIFSIHMRKLHR